MQQARATFRENAESASKTLQNSSNETHTFSLASLTIGSTIAPLLSMDLLLNLLWLALWIGAQAALFYRVRRGVRTGIPYLRCVLLLSCLFILLFPIISTADDICWAQRINHQAEPVAGRSHTVRGSGRYDSHPDLAVADVVTCFSTGPRQSTSGFTSGSDDVRLTLRSFLSIPVLRGPPPSFA